MLKLKKAFTLVELIIVITILAVLATIAFVSFSNYTKSARDTNKVTTLNNIEKGLRVFQVQTGKYPFPDKYVTISASGVDILHQGTLNQNIFDLIKVSGHEKTAVDNNISYTISDDKKKLQLLTLLDKNLLELSKKNNFYTSGDELGIIFDEHYEPIQKNQQNLELMTTQSGFYVIFSNNVDDFSSLTGYSQDLLVLQYGTPRDCKELLLKNPNLFGKNGFYNLFLGDNIVEKAYCDLTFLEGGWTQILFPTEVFTVDKYDSFVEFNEVADLGNGYCTINTKKLPKHSEVLISEYCLNSGSWDRNGYYISTHNDRVDLYVGGSNLYSSNFIDIQTVNTLFFGDFNQQDSLFSSHCLFHSGCRIGVAKGIINNKPILSDSSNVFVGGSCGGRFSASFKCSILVR